MSKVKYCIWFVMVWLAMIQISGKIVFFLFEIAVYCAISYCLKKKNRKINKSENKYSYERFDDELQDIADNCKALNDSDNELIDNVLKEAELSIVDLNERLKTYDFREFVGRNNVTWEEVENYLWVHCRYKGFQMWSEYINYLIKKGIILKEDVNKIFEKHKGHVAITPRPDLEAKQKLESSEMLWKYKKLDRSQNHGKDLANNEHWNYVSKDGSVRNIFKDLGADDWLNFEDRVSDNLLYELDYDAYLKRKGII